MQWITVGTPPFQSLDQVETVLRRLGHPEGLQARYVGTADGQPRIVSLWESKAHADRFFAETLPPVLAEVLGPEPAGTSEITGIAVVRADVHEPIA